MKKKYLFFLLIILLITACNKQKVDKSIVLKIGDLEVTKYEFEKNKTREIDPKQISNKKKLREWGKRFIDRCILIADAYEKKYDTIKSLQNQIKCTADFMMVQQYGYLWKETVSPVVDEFKKVTKEKADKRKKIFYFDYISCTDVKRLAQLTNNDTILENLNEYNKLKGICHANDFLQTGYMSQQWPFIAFWKIKDCIYNLKPGEVSRLLKLDDMSIYLYIDHIEEVELTQKDRENLQTELQIGIEKEIDDKKTIEMIVKGHPVVNKQNLDSILLFVSKGHNIVEFPKNLKLISYTIDNILKTVDFNMFMEYYNQLPMHNNIENEKTLTWLVNQYYYDEYLCKEAKKLGLYESDMFVLDKKNFQNNVMYGKYIENEIIKKLKTDSFEILDYYNKNIATFSQPRFIMVDLYFFDNVIYANRNSRIISDYRNQNQTDKTKDSSVIKGLIKYTANLKIDMESYKFPKEFINELINTKQLSLSESPVQYENKYVLIYRKEDQGKSVKKLVDVQDQIKRRITEKKIELKKEEILRGLRDKYKVEKDETGIDI